MSDLNFYWQEVLKLQIGERTGNERGVVTCYAAYMLLDASEGVKRTSCLDAARFLAEKITFDDVQIISE